MTQYPELALFTLTLFPEMEIGNDPSNDRIAEVAKSADEKGLLHRGQQRLRRSIATGMKNIKKKKIQCVSTFNSYYFIHV